MATKGVGGEITYCFLSPAELVAEDGPSADGTAVDVEPEVDPDLSPDETTRALARGVEPEPVLPLILARSAKR